MNAKNKPMDVLIEYYYTWKMERMKNKIVKKYSTRKVTAQRKNVISGNIIDGYGENVDIPKNIKVVSLI